MTLAPKTRAISWAELHADAQALAAALAGQGPALGQWDGIIAISRGGLVPAAIVAYALNCRQVETIAVATYENRTRGAPTILKPPVGCGDGRGFLVIDELVDSGTTLQAVRDLLPRAYYACIYAKPAGRTLVDRFVHEVPQETWLLLPWDPG